MKYYHLIKILFSSMSYKAAIKLLYITLIELCKNNVEVKVVPKSYDLHNLKWLTANWKTEDVDVYKEIYDYSKPTKTETLILFV